jgi:hypothetical protein
VSAPARLRVVWDAKVPAEVRAIVEPYVARYLHLLPAWLTELRVAWDAEDGNAGMKTNVCEEYRNGWLGICPKFLDGEEHWRHDTVVHEFVHFSVNPLYHLALRLIDHLDGQEKLQRHAKEDARRVLEGVTVDLTEALMRLAGPTVGATA